MKIKEAQRPTPIQTWFWKSKSKANSWLDGRSDFYSKIMEEPTTRRTVLRVHLIMAALMLGAISIEQRPLIALSALACAALLVRRLNKEEMRL